MIRKRFIVLVPLELAMLLSILSIYYRIDDMIYGNSQPICLTSSIFRVYNVIVNILA